ncbi:glycosyltransferase family 2 protein [Microvirga subterranea]|uniref:Glycosyl transferase family 2 n=1 Tax=Microvirga subterranea TaxID=186651 RepID=A0A370HEL3_9HYPH|nr:hypothetical protein [Microvirga subterranea]RDI55140.1 hypothetical protein DES45_11085 [Microvirga subterranea]
MITVLVRVTRGPEALAVTLSSLVPAVAAGLVGDAVILAPREDDTVARVADASGATLIVTEENSWKAGAEAARRDWILCLDDGDIPREGWIRVLDRFVALSLPERGIARLRHRQAGFFRPAIDAVCRLAGKTTIRAGDLVHRRVLLDGVRPRRPVRLAAVIERDPAFG